MSYDTMEDYDTAIEQQGPLGLVTYVLLRGSWMIMH